MLNEWCLCMEAKWCTAGFVVITLKSSPSLPLMLQSLDSCRENTWNTFCYIEHWVGFALKLKLNKHSKMINYVRKPRQYLILIKRIFFSWPWKRKWGFADWDFFPSTFYCMKGKYVLDGRIFVCVCVQTVVEHIFDVFNIIFAFRQQPKELLFLLHPLMHRIIVAFCVCALIQTMCIQLQKRALDFSHSQYMYVEAKNAHERYADEIYRCFSTCAEVFCHSAESIHDSHCSYFAFKSIFARAIVVILGAKLTAWRVEKTRWYER